MTNKQILLSAVYGGGILVYIIVFEILRRKKNIKTPRIFNELVSYLAGIVVGMNLGNALTSSNTLALINAGISGIWILYFVLTFRRSAPQAVTA